MVEKPIVSRLILIESIERCNGKMKSLNIFHILFFLSLLLAMPTWSMCDFNDSLGWPWNRATITPPDNEVPGFFINLGITGARAKVSEANLRALQVAYVFANTPAHGKLQIGDLIVGANGKAFVTDLKNGYGMDKFGGDGPCMDFGYALEESQAGNGILSLNIRRNSQNLTVQLNIGTKYGSYSKTFPYNCSKTDLILSELYPFIAGKQNSNGSWGGGVETWFAGLALLSSGDPQYIPHVKKAAQYFASITKADTTGQMEGLTVWNYVFAGILLSEYYLATHEQWVLRELEEINSWLIDAQFTDLSQQWGWTHGPASPLNIGGWGHNPAYEGYGPTNQHTGLALTAMSLMKLCGINVDLSRMELGYNAINRGTGQNGYVWYSPVICCGGPNDYADMGRTGVSALAHYFAPFSDIKYKERAKLNARCIGYDNRFKSFPDTHGSPHLGMIVTAMGVHISDDQGFRNLMDYHRWWFSLAQTHEGNQFVGQPSRDAGGSYGYGSRISASAVAALVLAAKNKTLVLTGKGSSNLKPVTHDVHPDMSLLNLYNKGVVCVFSQKQNYTLTIYSLSGKKRSFSGKGQEGINTISFGSHILPRGVYFIHFKAGDKIITGKYTLIF
ncbi:MAG: DUF6288 domain-containing protein [Chitinispirillaceae bacterium]|nr:DUF6288 domain-containing protein [Chitinispirillaceae bacterium]